ncbi:MAG: thiol:disulfide interchange protein DsbA/DsbL [Burkholderiaceae bacterium]|nr:thiol:disulfide interchange protein DsbA/DsbL [Burkholderiaceae bacterium]
MSHRIDLSTRRFLKSLGGVGLAIGVPFARAQPAPREGTEFRAVKPEQSTESQAKIEVLEFFWYGCPHCNSLEPAIRDWAKRLPGDVSFRKVHVGLGPSWVAHQQLFYTLESMNKDAELGDAIFAAIHNDRQPLNKPDDMADFVAKRGVDRKQFLDTWASFTVRTRVRKATAMAQSYGVDGVPAMAVNGRWYTAPSMAGGNTQALRVIDYLIERERKRGK